MNEIYFSQPRARVLHRNAGVHTHIRVVHSTVLFLCDFPLPLVPCLQLVSTQGCVIQNRFFLDSSQPVFRPSRPPEVVLPALCERARRLQRPSLAR